MVNRSSKKTIELENVGPVSRLSIPVPEDGGIVVLTGKNGAGKTETLKAVTSLVSGDGRVSVKDKTLKGSVTGFGASISVARNVRRAGELEVTSLEGRLSPADLVDPGMKDPAAADAKRILALVQLSGTEPDPSLFYDLIGGQAAFEAVCKTKSRDTDDIIAMASRIKRDFEAEARVAESQRDTALGHAKANREAAAGANLEANCDAASLQAEMEQAVRGQSAIAEQKRSAELATANAATARAELEKCNADPNLVTLEQANERKQAAADKCGVTEELLEKARIALREAERANEIAIAEFHSASQAVKAATARQNLVNGWEAAITAAASVVAPTEEEIAKADAFVVAARQAVEQGALVRRAKEHIAAAVKSETDAAELDAMAEKLRHAARGTDEVLSSLVGKLGTPLRVQAGRLVLDTERGETYFAELSMGQRWKLTVDLCVDVIGAAGVLPIPQEAWEGLDDINRQELAKHAKLRGVLILTAEAGILRDEDGNVVEGIEAKEFVAVN